MRILSTALWCGNKLHARLLRRTAKSACKKLGIPEKGLVGAKGSASQVFNTSIAEGLTVQYVHHDLGNCSAAALSTLTAADYLEFAPIKHSGARHRSLLTRAALRHALSAASGGALAPREWAFIRGPTGKPQLDSSCPDVHFSCSHADGVSVVAVSIRGPVGIDIANATTTFDLSVADLFLSPRESRMVGNNSAASPRQRQAFCRFWALKEAYVKLKGDMLSERVQELEFDLVKDRFASRPAGKKVRDQACFKTWQFAARRQNYAAAVAFIAA